MTKKVFNGTGWAVPVDPNAVTAAHAPWDTDSIEPVLITTVDETHPDDAYSGGGLGIHIIEVTFTEDTWRDLLVRLKPEDPEIISVWKQDPRAGATTGTEQPDYVGGYNVATNFWPFKFEANVTYYVGVYKDTWEGAGGVVDIGPSQYGLGNPSRLIAPRDLLFPTSFAQGHISHAEGWYTHAETDGSHAEGLNTHAERTGSHAEGLNSHAEGYGAHAEGLNSHAEGYYSHAEGTNSHAEGHYSHAEGTYSHARWAGSHSTALGDKNKVGYRQYERVVRSGTSQALEFPGIPVWDDTVLPENYVALVRALVVRMSTNGANVKAWSLECLVSTVGTPSIIGAPVKTVIAEQGSVSDVDIHPSISPTGSFGINAQVDIGGPLLAVVEFLELLAEQA